MMRFDTYSVCELSYRYFVKYENLKTEWKQMLQDSGITEDLQLGMENGSGLKGKWSKIFQNFKRNEIIIHHFPEFPLLFVFDYFLCSADYFYYYQNVTNDDIIKLHQKFHSDFLLFGYTLPGFLNKDERRN